MTPVRITVGLCIGFITIVLGMFVYSVTREPVLSDEQLRDMGVFVLPRPREIESFSLTDHRGGAFTLESLQDHWTFAFFGFTNCPDVCPTSMAVLGQAYRTILEQDPTIAAEFQGVLVSVDPERDDQQTLAQYVGAFSPDFIGVRGPIENLGPFAGQLNVAFAKVPMIGADGQPEPDGYQVDHTANIVIINPRGHYHGFIKYPQQADTIVAAFRTLTNNF